MTGWGLQVVHGDGLEPAGAVSAGSGFGPVESGETPDAAGLSQTREGAVFSDVVPGRPAIPETLVGRAREPPGVAGLAGGVPPSTVVRVPFPSVPAAPRCWLVPPFSTVLLAWMIAWRNGRTISPRQRMTAIPASAAPGRSHQAPRRGRGRWRGSGRVVSPVSAPGAPLRLRARRLRHGGVARQGSDSGQAQCPRQVQERALSARPARTANSQERGGRVPVRARIRSSPLAPGSTPPTAADKARRSASSKPSSGEDGSSSTCPPRHGVSCSRIDLSAAIARAV